MSLLFLEFLGTTELLVIAFVALIIFGPRKLPELGRSLGKSLGEFKRASEDFKRTWEREVEVESIGRELRIEREATAALDALPDGERYGDNSVEYQDTAPYDTPREADEEAFTTEGQPIARTPETIPSANAADAATAATTEQPRKQDWL